MNSYFGLAFLSNFAVYILSSDVLVMLAVCPEFTAFFPSSLDSEPPPIKEAVTVVSAPTSATSGIVTLPVSLTELWIPAPQVPFLE